MRRLVPVLAGLVAPVALSAQLPRTTARALGMLHSQTASARGYEAIAWNPALLAMPGRPSFSVNVFQLAGQEYSNAFDAGDFFRYSGDTLSTADKDTLLAKISDDAPLTLGGSVEATGIAVTIANFGLAFTGGVDAEGRIAKDFAELFLFGNILRRAPNSAPFSAEGSGAGAWGGATASLAFGLPIPVPVGFLAAGATVKLTQGILIAGVEDLGSTLQTDPFDAEARVHFLYTDLEESSGNGFGFGADLGVAYQLVSGLRLGLTLENAISAMSWDEDALLYHRREYRLVQQGDVYLDSVISELEDVPFNDNDPLQARLRDSIVSRRTFPTRLRAGAQLQAGPVLLAGDAMVRVARGLIPGEARRISAAAEIPLSVIAFRGGLASDLETGITFGGGLGFKLGPMRLDVAGNWSPSGDRQGVQAAMGLAIMK
jgi:hypothetical protein